MGGFIRTGARLLLLVLLLVGVAAKAQPYDPVMEDVFLFTDVTAFDCLDMFDESFAYDYCGFTIDSFSFFRYLYDGVIEGYDPLYYHPWEYDRVMDMFMTGFQLSRDPSSAYVLTAMELPEGGLLIVMTRWRE